MAPETSRTTLNLNAGPLTPARSRLALAGCGVLLLILGILTWRQCGIYRSSEFLWRETLARNPLSPVARYQFGYALQQKGNLPEAIRLYKRYLELEPRDADVHYNLGNLLFRSGQADEAIAHYRIALGIQPQHAMAHCNLCGALAQKGQLEEAVVELQAALDLQPELPEARRNLIYAVWLLAAAPDAGLRNPARAVALAEQLDRAWGGSDPAILRALAEGYAGTGRYPDAIAAAQRGLDLARRQKNEELGASLQIQIERYREHGRDSGRHAR